MDDPRALNVPIDTVSNERPRSAIPGKLTRGQSCLRCYQRKVKCDGKRPCSTCVKTSRAADCRSARTVSGLRLLEAQDQALLQRLRRYEQLLIAHGIPLNGQEGDAGEKPLEDEHLDDSLEESSGYLIFQRGNTRFVNNALWNHLGSELTDEFLEPSEADRTESSDHDTPAGFDMLLFGPPSLETLDMYNPSIPQILKLWQVFLDNFNPLVKLFHAPTVQPVISDAIINTHELSPRKKALVCAILLCAVCTLTDQYCVSQLGESKAALSHRFSQGTQQALINAGFLKSTDLIVLQALTLYLLARRHDINDQSLWLLTGVANRLAQAMGLHRESSLQKLSVFEAEIRRRLWWQVSILDNRAAQLSGAAVAGIFQEIGDTRRPLNVNDSDLSPMMREPLAESDGPTEMLFCAIRFEIGECARKVADVDNPGRTSRPTPPPPPASAAALKEHLIDALEAKIEKLLQRCDTSIPLHLMSSLLGRSAICQMRLAVRTRSSGSSTSTTGTGTGTSTSSTSISTAPLPSSTLSLALMILAYDAQTYAAAALRPYQWHVKYSFPFPAFTYVLTCLVNPRHPLPAPQVDEAWSAVLQTYANHPELVTNTETALYVALGILAVRAWERSQAARDGADCPVQIARLRAQRLGPRPVAAAAAAAAAAGDGGAVEGGSTSFLFSQELGSEQLGSGVDIVGLQPFLVHDVDMGWEPW